MAKLLPRSFEPLSPESMAEIAKLELQHLSEREGMKARSLELKWKEEVLARLAELGYDA